MEQSLKYDTPQERRVIYEMVMGIFKEKSAKELWGMCCEIRHIIDRDGILRPSIVSAIGNLKGFPELASQAPIARCGMYWYPLDNEGALKRVANLEKAIELCNK